MSKAGDSAETLASAKNTRGLVQVPGALPKLPPAREKCLPHPLDGAPLPVLTAGATCAETPWDGEKATLTCKKTKKDQQSWGRQASQTLAPTGSRVAATTLCEQSSAMVQWRAAQRAGAAPDNTGLQMNGEAQLNAFLPMNGDINENNSPSPSSTPTSPGPACNAPRAGKDAREPENKQIRKKGRDGERRETPGPCARHHKSEQKAKSDTVSSLSHEPDSIIWHRADTVRRAGMPALQRGGRGRGGGEGRSRSRTD